MSPEQKLLNSFMEVENALRSIQQPAPLSIKPAWYPSPINLKEARSGTVEVKHRILQAGKRTPVVGMRQAVTRGITPVNALLKEPLRIHELHDDKHGIWMTDLPEELNQIAEMLALVKPHGDVCIGGLGLGVLAETMYQMPQVDDLTVVERSKDVIKLCDTLHYSTVNMDIAKFLRTHDTPFDYYLLDTWQGTNEGTWWPQVMPLRRIIRNRFGSKPVVHCWAEDIMLGQVMRSLLGPHRTWKYEKLPLMDASQVQHFVQDIGLPAWEKHYGKLVSSLKE